MNKTMMCVFGCLVIGMALLASTAQGAKKMKVASPDLEKTGKLDKTIKDSASFQDRSNPNVAWQPGSPGYNAWVDAKAPKTADTFEFDKRNLTTTPGADLDDTFKDDLEVEDDEFRNPVGATADHSISIIE